MVAEHAAGRRAEAAQPTQRRERSGAAIDQVAEHVDVIARRRERDFVEQPVERRGAALDVADEVMHGSILLRWPPPTAAPAHGRCPPAVSRPSQRPVRDVGNGADREPQGAPAGDGGSGRFGRQPCARAARQPDQVAVGGADRHHLDRPAQRHRRRGGVLDPARRLAALPDRDQRPRRRAHRARPGRHHHHLHQHRLRRARSQADRPDVSRNDCPAGRPADGMAVDADPAVHTDAHRGAPTRRCR